MITALLIGAGALWLISRKRNGVSGIGAARKRRIYKELSLAQQAGVDFTKPYEDLTDEEIESLQRVSNETGYTETYYKSLQKAYNAISGIGEAYDVVDADGNTVLTWVEDPQAQAAKAREAEEIKQRTLEAEKRAEESRKRLRKTRRSAEQMSLFGCKKVSAVNVRDVLEPDLIEYLRSNLDKDEINDAIDEMEGSREPLYRVNYDLDAEIADLVGEWCIDNAIDPDSIWTFVDTDDIIFIL